VTAREEYRAARCKKGWSPACGEWRHGFPCENFGRVVPLTVLGARVVTSVSRQTANLLMTVRIEPYGGPA
jgi:hypothetical protein